MTKCSNCKHWNKFDNLPFGMCEYLRSISNGRDTVYLEEDVNKSDGAREPYCKLRLVTTDKQTCSKWENKDGA